MSTNKANRLIHEKSPYLLQHAYNPVDWYPWGDEAFEKAKAENKPIFLSIGYSTCHWCHVMERESFEDEEVADILNEYFVAIKVDREERPDIDHIYMTFCQAMTGHGGWPLTIIMTPDKKPFFAGTYFPKNDKYGMPGLISILKSVQNAWSENRDNLENLSDRIVNSVYTEDENDDFRNEVLSESVIEDAYRQLEHLFDPVYGGFGSAPKFPAPHNMLFLLRYWYVSGKEKALEMVEKTLDSMHKGGIYDHIGFGFCRYSTDRKWLVPHFEKMLYDNALLAMTYAEAYQATKKDKYARIAKEIYKYIERDMTSPEGAFYSAEDADTEGVEGLFYLWTYDEVISVLGDEHGKRFCRMFDITPAGNFEGRNIPNLIDAGDVDVDFIEKCRNRLFETREKRKRPFRDDKVLTSWNALMAASFAIGGRILKDGHLTDIAKRAISFIKSRLMRDDGRLLARYRDGSADIPAFLDDYAFLQWAYIELYHSTYEPKYLIDAVAINDEINRLFLDDEKGGFYFYGNDAEKLIARPKDAYDGAMPSGNSVMAMNLLKLSRLTGNADFSDSFENLLSAFCEEISRNPAGYIYMLASFLGYLQPDRRTVITAGEPDNGFLPFVNAINDLYNPFDVSVIYGERFRELESIMPEIKNYTIQQGKTLAYVCENFTCLEPVSDPDELSGIMS